MDPLYEQRLRDEVIYLHSLWHQGPPRSARRHPHLQPSQATQFKKGNKRKGTNRLSSSAAEPSSSPGFEWAVPTPPPPPPADVWPSLVAKTDPNPLTLSSEEQSQLASRHAHQRALKTVVGFFRCNNADGDSDSIGSSSDEDDESMDDDDGRDEYSFFFQVFKEDNELREYYVKSFVKGEFSCLVCDAIGGKKMGKKYKGCLPLVQHSITIAKTKKMRAHRAFGQAVCKVLGWDIDQLSSTVSLLSDKSIETQGGGSGGSKESSMAVVDYVSAEGDIVEERNDEAVPESGSIIGTGNLPNGDERDKDSLTCTDANKSLEDHGAVHNAEPSIAATATPSTHSHRLQPLQTTQFKKEKKQKGKKSMNKPNTSTSESNSFPGPEWAVLTPAPLPPADVWPRLEAKPDPMPPMLSPEEQSKLVAQLVHQHALKAVIDLFFRYTNADVSSDSIESSSDEDDEDAGREKYSFFFKVFKEDNKLREYYEKNFVKGEFSCLVCGALGGKKMGKKFKGCLPLVQHSITIAKTKKRRAHRAFGQAICKVLGWDINELSSIVSLLSDNSGETQGSGSGDNEGSMAIVDNVVSVEGEIDEGRNDKLVPESGFIGSGTLHNNDEEDMDCLTCTDADKSSEGLGVVVEEPAAKGLTNGIGSDGNNESLLDIVHNVLTAEDDAVVGKSDKAVPESGVIGVVILPNGDEQHTNSLTCADADESLEDLGMVHPPNIQEPAAEGLTNFNVPFR